jgi:hypothetical protein
VRGDFSETPETLKIPAGAGIVAVFWRWYWQVWLGY